MCYIALRDSQNAILKRRHIETSGTKKAFLRLLRVIQSLPGH